MIKKNSTLGERLRVRALEAFEILDTEGEENFDEIAKLAAQISGCPISLITLVDGERQWFKAKVGWDVAETDRSISFCHHVVTDGTPILVNDATKDSRFENNPLVTGEPGIRFYAGYPLVTSDGYCVGTLCTIDQKPRELSREHFEQIGVLAKQVVRLMELRVANKKLRQMEERLKGEVVETATSFAIAEHERARYEEVLSHVNSPIISMDGPTHVVTFTNRAYDEMFSPDASPIGLTLVQVLPDAAEQGLVQLLDDVYATGRPFIGSEIPFSFTLPNGLARDVILDFTYVAKRDDKNRITGVFASAIDVTEKVRARWRIEANERLLKQIFNGMPQMSFRADAEGNITEFNEQWHRYVGESNRGLGEEWKGGDIHHPEDLPRTIDQWGRSVRTGEPYEIEYRLRRADGTYRWHLGRATPIRDAEGRIVQWFGTNTDIHESRVAAERVAASENLLSLTTNAIPELMAYIDVEGRYRFVNQSYETWFGLPRESFIGKTRDQFVDADRAAHIQVYFEAALKGETQNFQHEGFYSGRLRVTRFTMIPDVDAATGEVRGVISVVQDETEVASARDEAERANSAKSAFLANMSHEIRTPLGAIMGFSELAQQTEGLPGEASEYLQIVQRNSVQTLKIIDDILDLAKVEAGRVLIERLDVQLVNFLADFSSLMGFKARDNGISFRLVAETNLPDVVVMDPTRVRQILTNAVGNAIKFTKRGNVTLHVRYLEGVLEFGIQDTGRGISMEQAEHLFQAFVQADVSTTRKFGGTGLGLILTKRLCQTMGGDFFLAKSEIGKGSHFTATIAAERSRSSRMLSQSEIVFRNSREEQGRAVSALPLANVRVLLVEDSPDNQELLRLILQREGAAFSLASNGEEGVVAALEGREDVILMDVQMPVMDGHEAVRMLRAKGFEKPIIALTAHAMKEEFERAIASGFTDYLSKPVNRKDLVRKIAQHANLEL